MPNKNSKGTSPNQKMAQSISNRPHSTNVGISNNTAATPTTANSYNTYTTPRRNSEISTSANPVVVSSTGQRITSDGNNYVASSLSTVAAVASTNATTSYHHTNKMKSTSKAFPLTNRPSTMATPQYPSSTITSLANLGTEEKFAYMVNNEEFPALNDSSVATMNNNASTERNTANSTLMNNNTAVLGDYESPPYDSYFLMNRNNINNMCINGNLMNEVSHRNIELNRYYTLPNCELPTTSTAGLEDAIATATSVATNDTTTNQTIPTCKEKDPGNFIKRIKKQKNVNGVSSLIRMFPLIDQVKMSYPYSKFSVGASVDLPLNLYHYFNKDSDNANRYIAPLIKSCPITALYRVSKHIDDYFVPLDYLTLAKFHEKSPFSCDKYSDEILLFLYYSHLRDGLQMLAAYHLHRRGWRFHLNKRQWITLTNDQYKSYTSLMNITNSNGNAANGNNAKKSSSSVVKDTFWFFNVYKWCMEKIETTLDFKLFESADVYAEFLHEATNSNNARTSNKQYSNKSTKNDTNHQKCHDQPIRQYGN